MPAASTGGGGICQRTQQRGTALGAGQAIDLLKGVVMPMITSAMKPAAVGTPGARTATTTGPGRIVLPPKRRRRAKWRVLRRRCRTYTQIQTAVRPCRNTGNN